MTVPRNITGVGVSKGVGESEAVGVSEGVGESEAVGVWEGVTVKEAVEDGEGKIAVAVNVEGTVGRLEEAGVALEGFKVPPPTKPSPPVP